MSQANIYRVVFAGEIVDGSDPHAVRQAAAAKLKASTNQVERLFCGRKVVIKRDIDADLASRYLMELRKIGMIVRLERHASAPPPPPPAPEPHRVICRGEMAEGFDPLAVRRAVREFLRLTAAQQVMVFSGRKVMLRRDLSREEAEKLVADLAERGLYAVVEAERQPMTDAPGPASVPAKAPHAPVATAAADEATMNPDATVALDSDQFMRHLPGAIEQDEPPAEEAPPPPPPVPAARRPAFNTEATMVVGDDVLRQALPSGIYPDNVSEMTEMLVEPATPPASARPAPAGTTSARKAAPRVQFVHCPQCGIRQSRRPRCMACGTSLRGATSEEAPDIMVPRAPIATDEPTVMMLPEMFGEHTVMGTPMQTLPPKRKRWRPGRLHKMLLAFALVVTAVVVWVW